MVAEFFYIGEGTINRIKSNRDVNQSHVDGTGEIPENIRKRKHAVVLPKFENIEAAVVEFMVLARVRGMPVTCPNIRTLAETEANAEGLVGFKASKVWLGNLKTRHGICGRALFGKEARVDEVVNQNWKQNLHGIIATWRPEDIYNLDETG